MRWFRRRRPAAPAADPYEPLPGLGPLSVPTHKTRHAWEAALRRFAVGECDRPPYGWTCSKGFGHDGPCPAVPKYGMEPRPIVGPVDNGDGSGPAADDLRARLHATFEEFESVARLASAEVPRVDGLTTDEGLVHDHLCAAVSAFGKIRRRHPDEMRDFADGIHRCQDALAVRIARRAFPIGWPDKGPKGPRVPEPTGDVRRAMEAMVAPAQADRRTVHEIADDLHRTLSGIPPEERAAVLKFLARSLGPEVTQ